MTSQILVSGFTIRISKQGSKWQICSMAPKRIGYSMDFKTKREAKKAAQEWGKHLAQRFA